MDSIDILAEWLKSADSLGGIFNDETEALRVSSVEVKVDLELAILEASKRQVAEDEHGFLQAIEPVKVALARVKSNLADWQSFLDRLGLHPI